MIIKAHRGFTLIELMIVVAIIAILAAIAMPAYQNYIKRSKITEGLVAADSCKASIAEYVAARNIFPSVDQSGCNDFIQTQYMAALTPGPGTGTIAVTFRGIGDGVDGRDLVLSPIGGAGTGQIVGWDCGGAGTTVLPQYLPASCR
ncbi:MAG: pilin [Dokdonella sp.]